MKLPAAIRRKLAHGKKVKVKAVVKLADANGRKLTVHKSKKIRRRRTRCPPLAALLRPMAPPRSDSDAWCPSTPQGGRASPTAASSRSSATTWSRAGEHTYAELDARAP